LHINALSAGSIVHGLVLAVLTW